MRAVTPFLMFQGEAAPALTLYLTLPGARLLHRQDTPDGRVQLAELDLMPPDDYGFSLRFAWLNDPHGVSWQVNLPHAP